MRALGCVADPTPASRAALAEKGVALSDLDTIVAESDFLCLHVPLDERTRYLVDAALLAKMKPGSLLINVARGGVVDEADLYEALQEGSTLAGAALDVHEREGEGIRSRFAELPNVVLTPHIGAMALDSQHMIGERVLELLEAQQRGVLRAVLDPDEIVDQTR
jgi:phosphoglycerate dehydrogenase-like enzyme